MASNEYTKKDIGDLRKLAQEKEAELQKFYFDIAGSRLKNSRQGRLLRKEIARIQTVITEKVTKAEVK